MIGSTTSVVVLLAMHDVSGAKFKAVSVAGAGGQTQNPNYGPLIPENVGRAIG